MKRTYKALLLSIFMIFGIYSCGLPTNNTAETKIKASKPENSKGLVGKAVFPASRKQESNFRIKNHGFKTKATATDIGSVSTISVITLGQNISIATGLTDVLGNFQLDMSKLTLTANAIYILEASKRTGEDVETIRTYIKWNGTSWESITTGDVIINENTTAISIIASYLSVSSIDLISKIDPANLTDIFDSTNANVLISKDDITNVVKLVKSVLLGERDPIALIKYDATKPYKYYVDQVYNYNNIATKNGCTGCSFIGADFSNSGASLAGKDLSYSDLSGQDLSKQDLSGTILIGADLSGATLPKDLSYLNLSDTNLTGQNLTQMDVKGTNFSRANLTGAILSDETTLKDLTQARFTGANFTNASLVGANLSKVYLFETIMDNTNIKKANFEKADLTGVNLSNVQGKDFTDVSFKDTTLIGSSFSGLDLSNIDLSTANVQGSDFSKAKTDFKKLSKHLQNCNFSEASIECIDPDKSTNMDFSNIDYSGANFSKSKLKNINFTNVNCSNCDFEGAEILEVQFSEANLENANFNNSIIDMGISESNLKKSSFENVTGTNFFVDNSDISYSRIDNLNILNKHAYIVSVSKADYAKISNSIFTKFEISDINIVYQPKKDSYVSSKGKLDYYFYSNKFVLDSSYFHIANNSTFLLNCYDSPPQNITKNIYFSNVSIDFLSGDFLNSSFINLNTNLDYYHGETNGYFKNCTFKNSTFNNTKAIIVDGTSENTNLGNFIGYLKNISFNIYTINSSFILNSAITLLGDKNSSQMNFSNQSSLGGILCKKTWSHKIPSSDIIQYSYPYCTSDPNLF